MRFAYRCNFMRYTRTFFPTIFGFEIFIIKQFIWDSEIGSQPPSLRFCCVYMQVPYVTDTLRRQSYQNLYSKVSSGYEHVSNPDSLFLSQQPVFFY